MDIRDVKEFIKDSFGYIIIFVIILLVVIYIVGLAQVVGTSMAPTLRQDDIVVISKAHYALRGANRYEVVSFMHEDTKYLIKRIIGLPGEHVAYENNQLYINGEKKEEAFLTDIVTGDFDIELLGYEKIPENYYFVMGDNRDNSLDSRTIGLISENDLTGKVLFRLYPFHQFRIIN